MAFQTKDFASIAASLINVMRANQSKVTDFSVGSVARTLLDAPAAEMEELYLQTLLGLQEAIPVAIYSTFAFQRLAARPATGVLTINVTSSASEQVVGAGAVFAVSGLSVQFTTMADVVIAAGGTVGSVLISCTQTGPAGNVAAGSAFTPVAGITGFVSATNAAPLVGGSDLEADEQRMTRFASFIASLSRGTVSALRYGMSLATVTDAFGAVIESVRYSAIVEPYVADSAQPVGWVQCYIHNGSTGASSALIARVAEILHGYYDASGAAVPGYKAAGVKVDVLAASSVTTAVTATVTIAAGHSSATVFLAIQNALTDYLQSLDIGKPAIRSEIIALIMAVDGVYNTAVSLPAADVTATQVQKIMPGTITLTAV